MFLLDVREERRVAQVSFTTGALEITGKWFLSICNSRLLSKSQLR